MTQPVSSTKTDPSTGEKKGGKAAFAQFTDLPIPEGAVMDLEHTLILGTQERWIGRLALETSADAPAVFDLYQTEMSSYGWQEVTAVRAEVSVMTFVRGERVATIQIQSNSLRGTEVDVTVSPRGATP